HSTHRGHAAAAHSSPPRSAPRRNPRACHRDRREPRDNEASGAWGCGFYRIVTRGELPAPDTRLRCSMRTSLAALLTLLLASASLAAEDPNRASLAIGLETLGDTASGVVARTTYRFTIPSD